MYTVSIYDKTKKLFKTYERIHTVKYYHIINGWVPITGEEIISHNFPCSSNYQFIGDGCNYSVDKSIIGAVEIEEEF